MACRARLSETKARCALRSCAPSAAGASTLLILMVAGGCAARQGTPQQPISANLAPAVASPATEAIVPMGLAMGGLSSTESTDPLNPGTTAPLTEPTTEEDFEGMRKNLDGSRTIRHTFVPKVTRIVVTREAPIPAEAVASRGSTEASAGLTDGQIVRVVESMHEAELAEAGIVEERAQSARVKEFAQRVRADSAQRKDRTQELAKSAGLTPRESPVSADVRVKASRELTQVELAHPEEFDRAFIDAQVQQNAELLQLFDSNLLPSATEPALKNELGRSRAALERQTQEARDIQRSLHIRQVAP